MKNLKTKKIICMLLNIVAICCYFFLLLNDIFELNIIKLGDFGWVGVEIVCLILFSLGLFRTYKAEITKLQKIVFCIYTFLFMTDWVINDSIAGITFLSLLLLFVISGQIQLSRIEFVVNLFLEVTIALEVFSVVALMDIISINSVMVNEIQGFWLDIAFVLIIIVKMLLDGKKNLDNSIWLVRMVKSISVVVVAVFILMTGCGMYLRATQYTIFPEENPDKSFYIVDAETGEYALTCSDGWSVLKEKLDYNPEQVFELKEVGTDGFQYLVTKDNNVVDIVASNYTSANRVCEYEEADTENQYWRLEPQDNGFYKIVSYDSNYFLTFVEVKEKGKVFTSAGITSNINDSNQYFYFINSEIVSIPLVGWITASNRVMVSLLYCVILVGIFIVMLINIYVAKRKKK